MAGFFQDQLKAAGASFFGNEYLRDYQHASKTFVTNGYAYSPKFKFLFHVYFDINKTGIGQFGNFPADSNFGLAVKSIQLPKFSFDTQVLNQYNRKRIVQSKVKYDPINITFHDDNNNLIRKLWYNYFTYYYKDATHPDPNAEVTGPAAPPSGSSPSVLDRTVYNPDISGNDDWGYVGETAGTQALSGGDVKAPFFNSISIYGFNQHNFVLYKLMNPIVESFGHDTYSYSENAVMENQMSVQFETVKYFEGALNGKNPGQLVKEFGDAAHYDTTLSPIARPGSQSSIMGPGGLVDAGQGIMDDLENGNWLGAIQKAGAAKNTFKNPANVLKIAKQEAINAARNGAQNTPNRNAFSFPSSN